jgi:hypothetical protein
MDSSKFEEYRLFIEDTARLQDRRQTVTNTYIGVNTVLLSALGLFLGGEGPQNWALDLAALALPIAGVLICRAWQQLLFRYRLLVRIRFRELRRMEELPEMAGCVKMYHAEDELYPVDENGEAIQGQGLNITNMERQLPWIFIALYVAAGAFMLVGRFLAWRVMVPSGMG